MYLSRDGMASTLTNKTAESPVPATVTVVEKWHQYGVNSSSWVGVHQLGCHWEASPQVYHWLVGIPTWGHGFQVGITVGVVENGAEIHRPIFHVNPGGPSYQYTNERFC